MKATTHLATSFFGFVLLLFGYSVTAQNFDWAKRIGGVSADEGLSITTDVFGNVYTTGSFEGTVDFDPGTGIYNLTSAGSDIFVSKLDASGNFIWAKQLGGTGWAYGLDIATDASGNIYTTGHFTGTADFDPGTGYYNLTAPGNANNCFVSKLDSAGNFVWALQFGGTISNTVGNSIALDNSGYVYTTGYFWGTSDFNPGPGIYNLTSKGDYDIFINKVDAQGNFIWARQLGGSLCNISQCITVDASGNVYTTGYFEGNVDFDPSSGIYSLTAAGDFDSFISKLNSSGNFVWARQIGGPFFEVGNSIIIDNFGNVYSIGNFEGTADLDPGAASYNFTSAGGPDIYLSKLDASGNFVWARQFGGTQYDAGLSLDLDNSGGIYCTGYFSDTVDFDPGSEMYELIAKGDYDIFISKLNASGNFDWAKQLGGVYYELSWAIDYNASGYIYTTGVFMGTGDFDPGTGLYNLTSAGYKDIFISKLCSPVAPSNSTPYGNLFICADNSATLNASGIGVLGWYSSDTGGVYMGGGSTFITPVLTSNTTYYVQDSTCMASSRTAVSVTVNPNLPVMVSISASADTVCEGTLVDYIATPVNGGSNPSFLWLVNGTPTSTNPGTLSYAPFNSDTVSVILTSSGSCISGNPATSNSITITVNPILAVSVSISTSVNNLCEGSSATFYATPANGGKTPSYQWNVNNLNTSINSSTYTYEPQNNDSVKVIMTSSEGCTSINPATSNSITMVIFPIPEKPSITINNNVLTSSAPDGNQWYLGSNPIVGAVSQQYVASENGYYTVMVTLNDCNSEMSDSTYMIITNIQSSDLYENVTVFPNPTTGEIYLNIPKMNTGEFTMKVMNNFGAILISSEYIYSSFEQKFSVDLSNLPIGVYTLLIQQRGTTAVRKMILKN